jgi:prophage regulatory protein
MKKTNQNIGQIILRRPEVEKLTGLSRSTIYAKINEESRYFDPQFPRPIRLGRGAVGWKSAEVLVWIDSCARL